MANIYFDFKGKIISQSLLTAAILGCQQTIQRMGKLGDAIEEFKVTFVANNTCKEKPVFKISFRDPLGEVGSHILEYQSGTVGLDPTAPEIADAMCASLPPIIIEHLKRCLQRIEVARDLIRHMVPLEDLVLDLLKFGEQFVREEDIRFMKELEPKEPQKREPCTGGIHDCGEIDPNKCAKCG